MAVILLIAYVEDPYGLEGLQWFVDVLWHAVFHSLVLTKYTHGATGAYTLS